MVTNNHLIQGLTGTGTVDSVTITTTNGKEYPARIVGRDDTSDLALLKIDGHNLPFVQWGDSTKARVGDWVIAIGNPYGLGGTVTAGIVSAIHRGIPGATPGAYDRYIQTDAAINMGNSGGPMFDLNGNVIGINAALISPTGASVGIGLAIPAELAKPVIDALAKGQRPQRGYLGVGLQPLDEDLAPSLGLPKNSGEIVRSLVANGPAARGGLQQGDVIVSVNGKPVTPEETVSYLIANTPVGSRVPLQIIRGGKRQTVTVTVGERPTEEALSKIGSNNPAVTDSDGAASPTAPQTRARPWPGAADARAGAGGEPARNLARRGRHVGRSQQRCGRAGPPARRPRGLGQQSARDHARPSDRHRRRRTQVGPQQGAAAGQARHRPGSLRRDRRLGPLTPGTDSAR